MRLKTENGILTVVICFLLFTNGNVFGSKDHPGFVHLQSGYVFTSLPPSISPESPLLRYAWLNDLHEEDQIGYWEGKIGAEYMFCAINAPSIRFGLGMNGFFILHNFKNIDPISWEALRANVGTVMYFEPSGLVKRIASLNHAYLRLGFNHESDHILDFFYFEQDFLNFHICSSSRFFDYVNFSAYEYVSGNIISDWRLMKSLMQIYASFGIKDFMSFNPGNIREMKWGWNLELQYRVRLWPGINAWCGFCYESVKNDFESGVLFKLPWNKEDLTYLAVMAGLELMGVQSRVSPHLFFMKANGRGIDFLKVYDVAGLAFSIAM